MALFYQPELNIAHLTPEESRHAVKVLRLRPNDPIELTDGQGHWCQAVITSNDERKATIRITDRKLIPRRSFSIHLAIAPTKNMDRMEWMVEKCTEIGVEKISFVQCKTSERPSVSLDRLHKVAVSAMKQSRQAWLPKLVEMVHYKDHFPTITEDQRFIAHVDDTNPNQLAKVGRPGGNYAILIGPEGDFMQEEIELALKNGFQKVNLGTSRLRTETAGLYAVISLNLMNR